MTAPTFALTPADVGGIRALLAAARSSGCVRTLEITKVASGIWRDRDWTTPGGDWVRVGTSTSGYLTVNVLTADGTRGQTGEPTSAQQVADLLGAKGIELAPVELTSGYAAGWRAAALAVAAECDARCDQYAASGWDDGAVACDGDAAHARRIANKVITATREESRS